MFEQGEEDARETDSSHERTNGSPFAQRWIIAAVLCLIVAGAFWWRQQPRATFVVAVLGVVAWFLNVRGQLRRRYPEEIEADDFSVGDESEEDVGT